MSIRGHSKIFSKHFHHLSQHKEKCFGQIQYHIHWKQAKKVISPQALLGAGRKQICRQDVEHHKVLVMTWIFHVVAPSSWKKNTSSRWVGRPRKAVMPGSNCEYHGAALESWRVRFYWKHSNQLWFSSVNHSTCDKIVTVHATLYLCWNTCENITLLHLSPLAISNLERSKTYQSGENMWEQGYHCGEQMALSHCTTWLPDIEATLHLCIPPVIDWSRSFF